MRIMGVGLVAQCSIALYSIALCSTVVGAMGCGDDKPPAPAASTTVVAATTAVASASASAAPESKPVCERVEKKVWGDGANARTGLTLTRLGGDRVAIGMAFGNRPHQLIFDAKGNGTLSKIALQTGSKLALGVNNGVRHLQRVTVADNVAFADYRDKGKDGRRRIACGPTHDAPYLVFDGEPILKTDDSGRDRNKTPAASPSSAPAGSTSASASASAAPSASAATATSASASVVVTPDPGPAPEPKPKPKANKPLRELRDCRTFSDAAGDNIWSVGSELRSKDKDGAQSWLMRFFAQRQVAEGKKGKGPRITLFDKDLGEQPEKLHTLEAPIAHQLKDGSFVLTGRYRGRMLVWHLNEDKSVRGRLRAVSGGYPTLPRIFAEGGSHLLLTSQNVEPKRYAIRSLRLAPPAEISKTLSPHAYGDGKTSLAEPTLAIAGEQRWLVYHTGKRRQGSLVLLPVDKDLKAAGKSFALTEAGVETYESYAFARDGQVVVAYITRAKAKQPAQLITETLTCNVQ